MKPTYTVIIYTPQELNHASYIQTGLFKLEQQGIIKLKVKLHISKRLGKTFVAANGDIIKSKHTQPKTSFYKLINNSTKKSVFFAADLYDFANSFSTEALEKCAIVFKRNFESQFIKQLPKKQQNKIFQLGLTFGVHSNFKKKDLLFMLGLFASNLNINFKLDRLFFNRLYKTFNTQKQHWKFIKTTRKLDRFEAYTLAKKNTILFQTRCFQNEKQPDVLAIHQQRYKIIQLLREKFPNEFKGGFISSNLSEEKYSNALSNVLSNPEAYLNVLKDSKIVIYTRGLVNSPAWKMAEYLSQGKVIIAEPLTAELQVPLEHGKEVLFFNSNEELIRNIQLVLSDEVVANKLSKNARAYFEKHVHPTQNVKRILDSIITKFKI